jgi:hypothetical protein
MTISILKTERQPAEHHTYFIAKCQTPESGHVEAMRSKSQDLELFKDHSSARVERAMIILRCAWHPSRTGD